VGPIKKVTSERRKKMYKLTVRLKDGSAIVSSYYSFEKASQHGFQAREAAPDAKSISIEYTEENAEEVMTETAPWGRE
jgi:hypothetical protein